MILKSTSIKRFTTCLLLFCLVCGASSKSTNTQASIDSINVKVHGEQLYISFDIKLGDSPISGQQKRVITPLLTDGINKQTLPSIVVYGKQRYLKDIRNGIDINSLSADCKDVIIGAKQALRPIDYNATISIEPWMQQASLLLTEELIGCACVKVMDSEMLITGNLIHKPQIELTPLMECPVAYVPRSNQVDAFLIYPVNQTVLYPEKYGNQYELQKIDSILSFVDDNPDYQINEIAIAGFASPEGKLQHNIRLSEGRAEALKNHIENRHNFTNTVLKVSPGSENWDGLKQVVLTSEIPYKNQILEIIDKVDDLDLREAEIKKIDGGTTYRFLLQTVYPGLRKNTFTVSYISRERPVEVAQQLVFTQPTELNVHEFYSVAENFYKDNPDKYNEVLLIAADTYPNHAIANANAAQICLETGEHDRAESYLIRTNNEPNTWNNRACMLWQKGNVEEAIVWWKKAAEQGDQQAKHNLEQVALRGYEIY